MAETLKQFIENGGIEMDSQFVKEATDAGVAMTDELPTYIYCESCDSYTFGADTCGCEPFAKSNDYRAKQALVTNSDGYCSVRKIIMDEDGADEYGRTPVKIGAKEYKGWNKFDGKRNEYQYPDTAWSFSLLHDDIQ